MNLLQELYLVKSIIEEEEELIKILFICHGRIGSVCIMV